MAVIEIIFAEGSSEFLVSIFSKEKISVLNGQVFISNNNSFNLSKKKNALNFVYDNGMKNVNFSDVLSNDMISDINLYKRNNTIYLSDLKTDQPKVLRVTNISGQVVFTKEISRESKDDNFDLIPNNEIIFISIISEHSILTKKLFH